MLAVRHRHDRVVGQIISVGVAIVREAAMLDDERTGLLARPIATVPSEQFLAGEAHDGSRALVDRPALGLAIHQAVLLPALGIMTWRYGCLSVVLLRLPIKEGRE